MAQANVKPVLQTPVTARATLISSPSNKNDPHKLRRVRRPTFPHRPAMRAVRYEILQIGLPTTKLCRNPLYSRERVPRRPARGRRDTRRCHRNEAANFRGESPVYRERNTKERGCANAARGRRRAPVLVVGLRNFLLVTQPVMVGLSQ